MSTDTQAAESSAKAKDSGAAKPAATTRAAGAARRAAPPRSKRPYDQGYRSIQRVWPD
ncbi:MAG: hypothetical protein JXM75_05760 [Chromatiaceae bacterium]|nr:hypothetical protein [Chromatiaceae bacterium]